MKQKRSVKNTKSKKVSLDAKSSKMDKKKEGNVNLFEDSNQGLGQLDNYKAFFRHLLTNDIDGELVDETD